MRLAILDMGTNVFSLLIARVNEEGYEIQEVVKIPSKIGEGGITKGVLTAEAFRSTSDAMKRVDEAIKMVGGVDKKLAIATSAVRGASNSSDYIKIAEGHGFTVEIITGNREAELIYKGVRESMLLYNEVFLIMDIGGGSNEFIIADKRKIYWKESFDMGVVRVRENNPPSNPITDQEIHYLENYYRDGMKSLWEMVQQYKPTLLIGCSGSFDTLRELIYPNDDLLVPSLAMERDKMVKLHEKLLLSNREQRAAMPGMSPIRVDYIVIGSILVNLVISNINPQEIRQSSYSLKEGCMAEMYESLIMKRE
jgi:exopolyphosphatase/guanosine-5'-triphosphate,3'-diphosphate pyrophosphatase